LILSLYADILSISFEEILILYEINLFKRVMMNMNRYLEISKQRSNSPYFEIPTKEIEDKRRRLNFYDSFLGKKIYIDSNILMEDCTKLIDELIYNKLNIEIPKIQYNEIYNLTKSEDKEKSFKSRNALRNIEILLDNDLIDFNNIDINKRDKNAYADPEFLKIIFNDLTKGKKVIFITDDRDLRIQFKIKLKQQQQFIKSLSIYSLEELEYPQYIKKEIEEMEEFNSYQKELHSSVPKAKKKKKGTGHIGSWLVEENGSIMIDVPEINGGLW